MIHPLEAGRLEAGCDEAGRGCLAGPVVAAAVILPPAFFHPLLDDSKKMTAAHREEVAAYICQNALAWAVASASPQEIDRINILRASITAMHRALDQLSLCPDFILVDGNKFYPYHRGEASEAARESLLPLAQVEIPHQCFVKGDGRFAAIAAASVLAKTYRDHVMEDLALQNPDYGWDVNKGYPTERHRQAIEKHGLTPHHRVTFSLLSKK